jgi:hypothetical protein
MGASNSRKTSKTVVPSLDWEDSVLRIRRTGKSARSGRRSALLKMLTDVYAGSPAIEHAGGRGPSSSDRDRKQGSGTTSRVSFRLVTNEVGALRLETTRSEVLMSPELHKAVARQIKDEFIPQWLNTPNPMLDESTPAEILARGEDHLIWQAIDRVRLGDVS